MEENKMNTADLANMLAASVETELTISIKRDRVELSGGTGIGIMDLYVMEKGMEALASHLLPIFKSPDDLKQALKNSIDLFDLELEQPASGKEPTP